MINLYLLRHGKAAKTAKGESDYERPLNSKGIAQIHQVGAYLLKEGEKISQLISSAAIRTNQTAQITNEYLQIDLMSFDEKLYLAANDDILRNIVRGSKKKSILYVGHNFGISDLASSLSGQHLSMSTGMIVHLTFELDDWALITDKSATIAGTFTPIVNQ